MNLETQSRQEKTTIIDFTSNDNILQKLNGVEKILREVREQSPEGIGILIDQVKSLQEK